MYWNKAYFQEAGLKGPPATFPELIDAAKKLVKIDSQGRMTRSGISLRLSGQGSGIGEKFRYMLEAAGGSLIEQNADGKWHNGYDNQAGRDALGFYVDAVQTWKIDDPKVPHDADAFASGATAMLFRESWVIGEIQSKNPKLDYGVAPIPAWKTGMPQHDAAAARGRLRERPEPEQGGGVGLREVPHQRAERTAADRDDRLAFAAHRHRLEAAAGEDTAIRGVRLAAGRHKYYVEPVLTAFDEVESRLADRLTASYIDPSLKGNPQAIAARIHDMAQQTDKILKDANLYG